MRLFYIRKRLLLLPEKKKKKKKISPPVAGGELLSADDERFELSEVVASHDFESCSFDRSDNHPQLSNEKQLLYYCRKTRQIQLRRKLFRKSPIFRQIKLIRNDCKPLKCSLFHAMQSHAMHSVFDFTHRMSISAYRRFHSKLSFRTFIQCIPSRCSFKASFHRSSRPFCPVSTLPGILFDIVNAGNLCANRPVPANHVRNSQILFLNLHARLNQIGIFNRVKTVLFIFNLFLYKTQLSLQEIEFSMQQIVIFTTHFYRFLTSYCVFLLYLL